MKTAYHFTATKKLLALPAVALLLISLSFTQADQPERRFSADSEKEILKFLAGNIVYPEQAKKSGLTGKFLVEVEVENGGRIKKAEALTGERSAKFPLMPEIVIIGYSSREQSSAVKQDKVALKSLESESERVSNLLGTLNIPEWKDNNMNFTLVFKFVLREEPLTGQLPTRSREDRFKLIGSN